MSRAAIPAGRIERSILVLRGHKVLLDAKFAAFYRVTTRRLNEPVAICDRFPASSLPALYPEEAI